MWSRGLGLRSRVLGAWSRVLGSWSRGLGMWSKGLGMWSKGLVMRGNAPRGRRGFRQRGTTLVRSPARGRRSRVRGASFMIATATWRVQARRHRRNPANAGANGVASVGTGAALR